MSSSTAIPASPQLLEKWRNQRNNLRFIIVRIQNEVLVEAASHNATGSLLADWGSLIGKAGNTAAYILMKIGSDTEWLTITYVPDDTRVKDKMVYAATKATLLNQLGYQYFFDELHATNSTELSYEYYQGAKKPVNARSQQEDIVEFAKSEENKEREFREQNANVRGSGGYHAVSLPFSNTAETMVRQIASGSVNFVELAINQAKNGIDGKKATDASVSQLPSLINEHEPRYYLYKYNGSLLFIYCCPDRSPQQLRMVYSTSKSSIAQQAGALGAHVSKSGELSEKSELTEQFLRELTQSSRPSSPLGTPTRASPSRPAWAKNDPSNENKAARPTSIVESSHPVYSLMTANPSRTGKKIVIPPPGAY